MSFINRNKLALVVMLIGLFCNHVTAFYPPQLPIYKSSIGPDEQQKQWALATVAMLVKVNDGMVSMLGGYYPTPTYAVEERKSLERWWNISSREDLFDTLNWIRNGGHRAEFDDMSAMLYMATDEHIVALRREFANEPGVSNKLDVILRYKDDVKGHSIIAWDYSRYIALCGWGYIAGYLTEQEAWNLIMPAAILLQQSFDSWKELGKNYLIGREFWSLRQTQKNGKNFEHAYKALLSANGLWSKLPWGLQLIEPKSLTDKNGMVHNKQ